MMGLENKCVSTEMWSGGGGGGEGDMIYEDLVI